MPVHSGSLKRIDYPKQLSGPPSFFLMSLLLLKELIIIILFRPCGFREENFFIFSHYKPMLDNDAPRAWPIWYPGIYEGGYLTLIHMKYLSSGSHGFRKGDL